MGLSNVFLCGPTCDKLRVMTKNVRVWNETFSVHFCGRCLWTPSGLHMAPIDKLNLNV